MTRAGSRATPLAVALALVLAGCSVPDLDLEGKECPCVAGWVCDPRTDTCERDPTPDAPPGTPDGSPSCPMGYLPATGLTSRYRTVMFQGSWLGAEQDCENDGAGTHLAIFDDAAEHDWAVQALAGSWWIGISDRVTDGTWMTVTGQATFFDGGATTGSPTDDCGRLLDLGTIEAASCFANEPYICECDGVPADPAFY